MSCGSLSLTLCSKLPIAIVSRTKVRHAQDLLCGDPSHLVSLRKLLTSYQHGVIITA